jgi:hypothetical protein
MKNLFLPILLTLCLTSCGVYKTSKHYAKVLPEIDSIAVFTPFANIEQLYLANDFAQEKPSLDTLAIEQGQQYIQQQVIKKLPAKFHAYAVAMDKNFQDIGKRDMLVLWEEIQKKPLSAVAMPAYLNEFLKKQNLQYVVITHHIGAYKTIRRAKQDQTAYNTKEALEVIFTATSPSGASLPSFPDNIISVLHLLLYDVKNQKMIYYAHEKNQDIDEPNVPIPTLAADKQIDEILKKISKDSQKNN